MDPQWGLGPPTGLSPALWSPVMAGAQLPRLPLVRTLSLALNPDYPLQPALPGSQNTRPPLSEPSFALAHAVPSARTAVCPVNDQCFHHQCLSPPSWSSFILRDGSHRKGFIYMRNPGPRTPRTEPLALRIGPLLSPASSKAPVQFGRAKGKAGLPRAALLHPWKRPKAPPKADEGSRRCDGSGEPVAPVFTR